MSAFDLHAHVLLPEVDALVEGHPLRADELRAQALEMGQPSFEHNVTQWSSCLPKLTDLAVRVADMDRAGVATQALSISLQEIRGLSSEDRAEIAYDSARRLLDREGAM